MDSQDNNYMAPSAENGVIDESGNVDRIRNILFGSQMRDYDGRFQKLEERLAREASELRSELQRQLQALEAFMKGEAESMANRVKGEQSERAQAIQQLAREMGETVRGIELKISNLDGQAAKDISQRPNGNRRPGSFGVSGRGQRPRLQLCPAGKGAIESELVG